MPCRSFFLIVTSGLVLPVVAARDGAAQAVPRPEIGTQVGVSMLLEDWGEPMQLRVPGGGPRGIPVVHGTFFIGRYTAGEALVGIELVSVDSPGSTRTTLGLRLARFTAGGWRDSPFAYVESALMSTPPERIAAALGAGLGYRWVFRSSVGVRLTASYRYWFDDDVPELAAAFGFGVLIPRR